MMTLRVILAVVLFSLLLPAVRAQAQETIRQRVEALIEQMTLEEKVGQMTQLTLAAVARDRATAAAGPTAVDGSEDGLSGGPLVRLDEQKLVEEGAVTEERIDASVRRILHLKMELGLLENPYAGAYTERDIHTEAFQQVALEAARRSMTLLKNERGVLPLREGVRVLDDAPEAAQAVLMAYLPGMEGGRAIADVLAGDVNPSGRLSFTYPAAPNDLLPYDHPVSSSFGVWLDERNAFQPEWSFGHGLSYTTFAYSELSVDRENVSVDGSVQVEVTVRNTGDRAGRESVLLFVADEYATVAPPVRRLRGFEGVELEPGEAQRITFMLDVDELAFVGPGDEWIVEPGTFRVEVGDLSDTFEVMARVMR